MLKSKIYEFMKPFYVFVCLFFLSDTLIIFSNTENIAATYHSSLDGNSDCDVVYLSFQNTSTQICKNSMSSNKWQLCFLYLCKLLLCRLKKMSALYFYLFSYYIQGKKRCLIPGFSSLFSNQGKCLLCLLLY